MHQPPHPYAIHETPVAGLAADDQDPFATLERDLCGLVADLARTRHTLDSERERHTREQSRLLGDLLEVLDALDRVFTSVATKPDAVTPQMKKWLRNFETSRRLFLSILESHGVHQLPTATGSFDPHWHKAAEVVTDSGLPPGAILREERPGYSRLGQVLRKAEVAIAADQDAEPPPDLPDPGAQTETQDQT